MRFTTGDGQQGSIALIAVAAFAEALERAASDEILLTSCVAALEAGTRTIGEQAIIDVETEAGSETDPETRRRRDRRRRARSLPAARRQRPVGLPRAAHQRDAVVRAPAPDPDRQSRRVERRHAAPTTRRTRSYVLADVEMGVTAELGRCRMTVRELLSITPGAVIDLDRAAGAPVDVLVNGTLIARGEVVVIDEEFGIRISELVPQPAAAR